MSGTEPSTAASPREVAGGAAPAPVFCVVGMHRSGTSLVASLLRAAGITVGERLLAPGPDNPRGFFEDEDFLAFHERCLARRGRTYAEPGTGLAPWSDEEWADARALIAARAGSSAWGWKDPRTCLFLDAWHRLLPDCRFIVVLRHPMAIVASLLRRGEPVAVRDTIAVLETWKLYTTAILDFLSHAHPRAVVIEAPAIFTQPDRTCRLLNELGVPLTVDHIARIGHAEELHTADGVQDLLPVADALSGGVRALYERMRALADVACAELGADGSAPSAARTLASLAPTLQTDTPAGRHAGHLLLIAGLCLADPTLGAAIASSSVERVLATEQEVARENHAHAMSAEAASLANYQRALSAEAASLANYERALAAESRSVELDGRAASAELQLRHALQSPNPTAEHSASILRLTSHLGDAASELDYYRRRWPPYVIGRVARRLRATAQRFLNRTFPSAASERFGVAARVAVLFTGTPEPAASVATALQRQTRMPDRLVMPGACGPIEALDGMRDLMVANWWGPDLARLAQDQDYVLLLHPEKYGPGPLWSPLAIEMAVAGLADAGDVAAILFLGAPGAPTVGTPNHLHETDAATVATWPDETLAAVFRTRDLCRAFPVANPGERRSIQSTIAQLLRAGRRVLVAPRHFPLDAGDAARASSAIGAALPATPRTVPRALYVTQYLECGGADKGAVDLLTRLDPAVAEFSFMTTVASQCEWAERVSGHVRELCLMPEHLPLPPERRFTEFLVEYVRRRDIGLVHIMHSFLAYDALPLLKRELPRVVVVDQCHILEPPHNMEGGHPAYSSRRYKHLLDHRTVTSQWLKRYLVDEHQVAAADVSVIYTGVDWQDEFDPERYPRGPFRTAVGVPSAAPLVVFLGRLHWQKRPWLFVDVAAEVQRRRPDLDAYFVLVGPGSERERVELLRAAAPFPDRIRLAGAVPHSAPVLRDADLMLMPSSHEGLSFASFEAMAMGVPQIFTDVNAQSELITPETGVLLPTDDEAALVQRGADAVIDLLDQPHRRTAMADAGRRRVREHFGIDAMVQQYEALYRRLCGPSERRPT